MNDKEGEIKDPEETENPEEAEAPEEAPAPAPAQPVNMQELKVVINIKGNKAVIGVQSPGCDPVFGIAEGDLLKDILMEVAGFIEIARDKWMVARQYPKSDLPQPVPAPAPAPRQATKTTAKPSSGKEKIDEKLWKPMF